MKIKILALSALMTLAVTSVFAQTNTTATGGSMQGMMMPSMEDQDYSDWKSTWMKLKTTPAGATSSMKMLAMEPQFRDEYDAKVFKHLVKMTMAEHQRPYRQYDMAYPIMSSDAKWMHVEMKLNAYRRELISENEARRMELDRSMGRSTSPGM